MKIKFFLAFLPFLFFACQKETVSKTTIQEMNNILEKNIELQQARFNKIHREIIDDINEPAKHKYTFLLLAAGRTITSYENFIDMYQKKVDSLNLFLLESESDNRENFIRKSSKELNNIDLLTINTFDSLLNKNYKTIGLKHDDMKSRLVGIQKEYSSLQKKLIPTITTDIKRNDVLNMKLKFIKYAAVHKAHFFVERFRELAGGKVFCQPHWISPLIQTKKNIVKKGEYFEAKIFVGNSYNFHPLDEPKIIVNGDTLEFDKGEEFATYKIKTKKRGEKKLNLEFFMFNKLTGKKHTRSSEYVIKVE